MDKKMAIKYLIGTYLLTYIMWGIIIVANLFEYLHYGTPISLILFIIGGNAPPIIAYIILKKSSTFTGFKEFVKKAFEFKQKRNHYYMLLAFMALYFGVPALLHRVTKGVDLYIGIVCIPLMILGGGLEELGWRYILQPSLEKIFPYGIATLITACIWSLWHLPLFFISGTAQSNQSFVLFAIMVLGMSFALSTIFRISKSIWLCILFHSVINALSSTWLIDDNLLIKVITTATMVGLSFIIIIFHNSRQGLNNK